MIEENVVSSAGTTYNATSEDFVHVIRAAGFTPVQRDTLYRTVTTY
jgi:cyclic dehypoxanthinyl futalosine synthase